MNQSTTSKAKELLRSRLQEYSLGNFSNEMYKVNFDLIRECKGDYVGNHIIPEDYVNQISSHQTRAEDYCKDHVRNIKEQIIDRGLKHAIVGELDDLGNVVILSGHHRIEALKQISLDKKEKEVSYPIAIVKFYDDDNRDKFKQKENSHLASLNHNMYDAIKYLITLYDRDYYSWSSRSDVSNLKTECYKVLKDAGYTLSPAHKAKIFKSVFNHQIKSKDTISHVSPSDAKNNCHKFFNVEEDSYWDVDDEFVMYSSADASKKTFLIALNSRAFAIHNDRADVTILSKIKTYIHFLAGYGTFKSLEDKRHSYLEFLKIFNMYNGEGTNTIVSEVVFAAQFRSSDPNKTETEDIHYEWNSKNQNFE